MVYKSGMKYLLAIILVYMINTSIVAQRKLINQVRIEFQSKIDSIQYELNSYKKFSTGQINKLNTINDSISKENILNKKLIDQYEKVIEIDGHLFDGTSMYLSIISIFVTILAIVVPGVFYFFVYEPNRKLKNEIDDKIENSLNTKLDEQLKNRIEQRKNQLLSSLNSLDGLYTIVNALFVNDFQYNEEDSIKIIQFLKEHPQLDRQNADFFHKILSRLNFPTVRQFYRDIINDDNFHFMDYAIQFFVEHEINNSEQNYLIKMIKSSDSPHDIVNIILRSIMRRFLNTVDFYRSDDSRKEGLEKLSHFIENEKIVNQVKDIPLKFSHYGTGYQVELANVLHRNPELKESLYYKKYLANIYEKKEKNIKSKRAAKEDEKSPDE